MSALGCEQRLCGAGRSARPRSLGLILAASALFIPNTGAFGILAVTHAIVSPVGRPSGSPPAYSTDPNPRVAPGRAGIPSRKLARPGRARVGKVERPTGPTTFPTRARSGCLRCAMGHGARPGIPESPGSRGGVPAAGGPCPGRRAGGPAAGGSNLFCRSLKFLASPVLLILSESYHRLLSLFASPSKGARLAPSDSMRQVWTCVMRRYLSPRH